MATTLTLPATRFVAQVNSGAPEAKANYKALAQRNALELEGCPWLDAASATACPSLVEHDFTKTFSGEKYDAFCMTGNYDSANNTEIAYAGMVAYRFKLPQAYLTGSATLVSASVMLSRDRFLLPGLRLSAFLSDSDAPSTDWSVVRGDAEGCVKLAAQLANTAERITAATQATEAVSVDLDGADSVKKQYLWLYLTVEDYQVTWTWYSSTQHRLYAIEGSGMIIAQSSSVTFSADVAPDGRADGDFPVLRGGIFPCVPKGSAIGDRHVVVKADANLVVEPDGAQAPSRSAPGDNAASALSRLYAEFYSGGGETPIADEVACSSGASFNVSRQDEYVPTSESDRPEPVDLLRIDSSALVMPFVWPTGRVATSISMSFAALSMSVGACFNVFYSDGYLTSLTSEQAMNPALYDGGADAPFSLLGRISRGSSASFAAPLSHGRMGTLIITGWLPPEKFDYSGASVQGTGATPFMPEVTIACNQA